MTLRHSSVTGMLAAVVWVGRYTGGSGEVGRGGRGEGVRAVGEGEELVCG